MASKYIPLHAEENYADKLQDAFHQRSSSPDSLGSTLLEHGEDAPIRERRFSMPWIWLAHVVLLATSFAMFAAAYFQPVSTLTQVQHFSAYSPAAEAVEYQTVKFNATMGEGSPYVGKGPEVDKAWHALSYDIGDQVITDAELKRIDMPKTSLRATHPKTGVEGYRVGLEVFHQLHCINLLRQVTYKEYYEELGNGNFAEGQEALQMHTDHCLEILRMNIQCTADIGLYTFYMLPGDPLPWPELNSWHTCRNFDKVRDWALDNSVGNMERPDIHPE